MKKPLETSDAAKALGVSTQRVIQLEQKGLIHAERTMSGTRLFDADEVKRVKAERAKKGR